MPVRFEVGLGLGGDVARVAAVRLVGERVEDREVQRERLRRAERVDVCRRRVGDQLHVRLVDRLEAADRRAVEHQAVDEEVLVEGARRHVEVLHDARQVAEPDVDELDVLVLDVAQDLVGVLEHPTSLVREPDAPGVTSATVGQGSFSAIALMFRRCYPPGRSVTAEVNGGPDVQHRGTPLASLSWIVRGPRPATAPARPRRRTRVSGSADPSPDPDRWRVSARGCSPSSSTRR